MKFVLYLETEFLFDATVCSVFSVQWLSYLNDEIPSLTLTLDHSYIQIYPRNGL